MNEKKIEPTEEMVDEAANMLSLHATGMSLRFQDGADKHTYRHRARVALRVALNRPAAPGLFADEDDRPWEPLNEDDSLHVGDEVRRDYFGTTTTAVVGRVDDDGAPWTAEGCCLGLPGVGTWYIRRPAQELPTGLGAVIVPAEGREFIEAVVNGHTYYAREAMLINGLWRAVWRTPHCFQVSYSVLPWKITPGTWKAESQ